MVVLNILKKEAGSFKIAGDYTKGLLNEVLCLAGANKLVSHHKD